MAGALQALWGSRVQVPASQKVFAALLSMLPPESAEHVIRAVLSFTSSAILGLFVEEDGVQTYNIFALFRLHADVSGLARFAATFTTMPGLQVRIYTATVSAKMLARKATCRRGATSPIDESTCALQAELAEALQICELFVLGHPEEVAKPGVRKLMFPALDEKRLIVALKRYRDVHPHFQTGHGLPGLQVRFSEGGM